MKITIENKSSLDLSQAARVVADLLHEEIDFMLANTVRGCHFKTCGVTVGLLPVCKEHPAGEMCFYVWDEKKEAGK